MVCESHPQGIEIRIAYISSLPVTYVGERENMCFRIQQLEGRWVMLLLGNMVKFLLSNKIRLSFSYFGLPMQRKQHKSIIGPQY